MEPRHVLIRATVLEEGSGYLFVEIDNGFGNPQIRVCADKVKEAA